MDIVNWDYLKNKGLLVRNALESPEDLVLVAANTTYKKRGDLFQTYAVPASALGGGGGGGGISLINTAGLVSGGPITTTGTITTRMATNRLVGRYSPGTGVMQEIILGTGLTFDVPTGTLNASGSTTLTQIIGIAVDGSGGTVTTGLKGYMRVPFDCTITGWTVIALTATPTQAIQFDIWRASGALPTSAGDSLIDTGAGGVKPRLTASQQLANSANVNNWDTALAAGDYLAFRVDSSVLVSWAVLQINITTV
jgi:hypothetical protein